MSATVNLKLQPFEFDALRTALNDSIKFQEEEIESMLEEDPQGASSAEAIQRCRQQQLLAGALIKKFS
jgi:hypothetical protein